VFLKVTPSRLHCKRNESCGKFVHTYLISPESEFMSLQSFNYDQNSELTKNVGDTITEATALLKAVAHEGRLMILSKLSESEASVSELEDLLDARQAAVSQQLARLRQEGLVKTRRSGKAIYYSLADERVREIIGAVHGTFGKH